VIEVRLFPATSSLSG